MANPTDSQSTARRWRVWLGRAALAAILTSGVSSFADDLAPPARFRPVPDAIPLEAPAKQEGPSLDVEGPSLGNEWTSAGRRSARPAPKAEFASHAAPSTPTLKPTSGSLNWRPKNPALANTQVAPAVELGAPTVPVKAGAWDDAKPLAKPSQTRSTIKPLADPFGDKELIKAPAPANAPSKLELPNFPEASAPRNAPLTRSIMNEAPVEIDPAPSPPPISTPKTRPVVKVQPRAVAPDLYQPEPEEDTGPVRNIWEGSNCDKNNKDCAMYVKRAQEHQLSKLTKAFLDISAPAPTEERQDVPVSKKAEILAKMEDRVWTNKRGEKVAEGKWTDFVHGRIVVSGTMPGAIRLHDLSDDDKCLVALAWSLPQECDPHYGKYNGRDFIPSTFTWTASALCHKPLYFEHVQLERYGHTPGPLLEPFTAGAHFFVNIAILPYKMGINPMGECQYSIGYYRPGSCAPWMIPPFPLSLRGAAMQVGAVYGVHAMMP